MIDIESPLYKQVYNHIAALVHSIGLWGTVYKNNSEAALGTWGCHSPVFEIFKPGQFEKIQYFATCAAFDITQPIYGTKNPMTPELYSAIQEYLEWLMTEDSPWWNLHKGDILPMRDEKGFIRGFVLGPSVFTDSGNAAYAYNFLIAARMTRDHPGIFKTYAELRKQGFSIFQSYLMGPYVTIEGEKVTKWTIWNASHQPLNEGFITKMYDEQFVKLPREKWTVGAVLDIKKFRHGEYTRREIDPRLFGGYSKDQIRTSSSGWMSTESLAENMLSQRLESATSIKTRFSSIPVITLKELTQFINENIPR